MLPICDYFIPRMEFQPSGLPAKDQQQFLHLLALAKLLATNAKQATQAFVQRKLTLFDPIVHENACQIRALYVLKLSSSQETIDEAEELKQKAIAVEDKIRQLHSKPLLFSKRVTFSDALQALGLSLVASPSMIYLLQAYFLTVGKVFQVKRDGAEIAYIDSSTLKQRISKQVTSEALKEIIDFTQVKLAEASIRFIQSQAGSYEAQFKEDKIVMVTPLEKGALARPSSCAFYNFKVILLKAHEEKMIVVVKKYQVGSQKPLHIFYRSEGDFPNFQPLSEEERAQLQPKDPLFVLEGFLPEKMDEEGLKYQIQEISLMDLALMNASRVLQFSDRDADSGVYQEIMDYRKKAQGFGCSLKEPRVFSIVHTHAAVVEELQ